MLFKKTFKIYMTWQKSKTEWQAVNTVGLSQAPLNVLTEVVPITSFLRTLLPNIQVCRRPRPRPHKQPAAHPTRSHAITKHHPSISLAWLTTPKGAPEVTFTCVCKIHKQVDRRPTFSFRTQPDLGDDGRIGVSHQEPVFSADFSGDKRPGSRGGGWLTINACQHPSGAASTL